jgi:hypothetical protein
MRRIAMVAVLSLFFFAADNSSPAFSQVVPAFNQAPAAQPIYAHQAAQPQRSAEAEQVRGW